MKNKNLIRSISITFTLASIFIARKAYAFCPVCTLAIGAGLVLLEKYGVDNTISGVWIGALTLSSAFWTVNWLKKKNITFPYITPAMIVFYYACVIWPLWYKDVIGLPGKSLWGIDKVVLGMAFGSVFFYLGGLWYEKIKAKNGGHAWFPFQKIVWAISPLIILSAIFYFMTLAK